jgi:hypothetical protein
MTVKEMIENYLISHGFTGLCNLSRECGCELSDLAPCESYPSTCVPGYKVTCTEEDPLCVEQDHDPGDWHIQLEKPEAS